MKICFLDAFSGISGDMTVGALIDAGASAEGVIDALSSLGARVSVEKTRRGGVTASKFHVEKESAAGHRHLPKILGMIAGARIGNRAKRDAAAVFTKLGEAEARVHGVAIEKVHFHEVGAMDSIADIVGACVALELLGIDELRCSAINVGSGTVKTEHGVLPVPAPATAALLEGKPVYARGPEVELTTPTGAAIVATLAVGSGVMPAMRILSIGYGAGDRDFAEQPNVLRAIVGESGTAPEATLVSVIEANIVEILSKTATRKDIKRLQDHLAREEEAWRDNDRRAILKLSGEFHLLLAESANNSILLELLRDLISRSSLIIAVYQAPGASPCPPDAHRELTATLERRERAAIKLMTQHLDHLLTDLMLEDRDETRVDLRSVFGARQ